MAGGHARLLRTAGYGDDRPLDLGRFAATLYESRLNRVVYHESHDESGNSAGSMRTILAAVNGAPLYGATRVAAEARARVAFGLSLFSAGTPMLFMADEVGARKPHRFDSFLDHREDIAAERAGDGARLFRFYQDAIRCSRRHPAVRVRGIDIVHVDGGSRVIAFRRSTGTDDLLVVASLSNHVHEGYGIETEAWRLPDGSWREVLNSDAAVYGGAGVGNLGADIPAAIGRIRLRVPANAVLVLARA
jgi:1,4-alpha-glucan branching enzyme